MFGQGFGGDVVYCIFVFDQQDMFFVGEVGWCGFDCFGLFDFGQFDFFGFGGLIVWQEDGEGCFFVYFIVGKQEVIGLFDDVVYGGQVQFGVFVGFFGGEERFEDFVECFFVYVVVLVFDFDGYLVVFVWVWCFVLMDIFGVQ